MKRLLATILPTLSAAGILAAAGVYAVAGAWPWRTSPGPPPRLVELFRERVDTLRAGETVSQLFARQGLLGFTLSQSSPSQLFDPRRLRSGLVFSFQTPMADSTPARVVFRIAPEERIVLRRGGDGWLAELQPIEWQSQPVTIEGRIMTSLSEALNEQADEALLSRQDRVRLTWDLADIFAWQVDFSRDLRPGDEFRVVAERLVAEDGEVRYGRVLAGDLRVGGERFTAYRWTTPDGHSGFYDADGHSLRRSFLLAPLQFRRISSSMSTGRMHPILRMVRKHEGTDYAADAGTPVLAAGDGMVVRKEWNAGYGNLLEIQHMNGIVTRYGHLQGFADGIMDGVRVWQGQVIGYVGSTGLATGPHLHYEFRVNGVARDPRSAGTGDGDPVSLADWRGFNEERGRLAALLAGMGPTYARGAVPFGAEGPSAIGASF